MLKWIVCTKPRENTVCQGIWQEPIMLYTSAGIPSNLTIHLSVSLLLFVTCLSLTCVCCRWWCYSICRVCTVYVGDYKHKNCMFGCLSSPLLCSALPESHAVSGWWWWWLSNVRMSPPESGNCDWFLSLCQWCSVMQLSQHTSLSVSFDFVVFVSISSVFYAGEIHMQFNKL